MKLLAIETAAEACSAAIYDSGAITQRFELQPRKQSELILPMVESLLAESGYHLNQLDGLAFGAGPGSFTGVRIATGVVQGLAFAADRPVVPVSTLAALAQGSYRESGGEWILAAFDARMGELYWGGYQVVEGLVESRIPDQLAPAAQVQCPSSGSWRGCGSGWASYRELLEPRLGGRLQGLEPDRQCQARDVALLGVRGLHDGMGVAASEVTPVYLRDKVADKPGQKR